jgi:outer membrane protein assembly factor BamB
MDEGPTASVYLPSRWRLTARDAYSGVLLWKRPIDPWHARLFPLKSGPLQLPRRLVAAGDRVYVTLGIDLPVSELDAATGRILRTFPDTEHAEELLYADDKLLVVVNAESAVVPFRGRTPANRPEFFLDERAVNLAGDRSVVRIDARDGKVAWKTPPAAVVPLTMASDGRRVFFLRGDELVSADARNGHDLWAEKIAPKQMRFGTASSPTLLVHQDVVYLAIQGELTARDATTGESMWSAACSKGGYRAPASIFVVGGLIWDINVGGEPYRPGSDRNNINRAFTGYDLRTGKVVKQIPVASEHGYAIMHHRCHVPRASGRSIITSFPGIEFFNVDTGESTHDSWLRGACLYGFMPANGLIYTPPHPCACYTQGKLTGFWAVAGRRSRPAVNLPLNRLEKGPAYDLAPSASTSHPSLAWPTYRGDATRSGSTSTTISVNVEQRWNADVGSSLSQCVISDGRLFVATREDHTVHALEADSGAPLWQFTAGGRIDSAPTYYGGRLLFGSRDGHVYCVTADRGQLVWRFCAAPMDQRCVSYDQVESVWPVHGSVLVHEDVLWCCAGRSSYLDGGLVTYRLDARTGQVLSTTKIDSLDEKDEQPPITPTMFARLDMQGAKNDVLSCDGNRVFMRHWAFDLEGQSVPQDRNHLFSPTGFLDVSWFRRTYWIYGRSYVSGAQGWARTGNVRPSGRILSLDGDRLYGFGRDYYPPSPGNQHQMYSAGESERLFAALTSSDATSLDSSDAAPRRKPASGRNRGILWTVPADLQVRGMVLAGEGASKRLIIAGAKGDWVVSQEAYEGKLGSVLRMISVDDGRILAEQDLPGCPIFDGMSAADGRLYVSLTDGRIVCLGTDGTTP